MTSIHTTAARAASLGLAIALGATAAPAQSGKLAVKAGRVLPAPGAPEIENGVIVIENGRITAVGDARTKIPWDAEVIDAPNSVAFPGYVEPHTWRGIDRPNENIDVVPFLRISDSVDPVNAYFEDALRRGVTTINVQQGSQTVIAGQGLIVKPVGRTVESMLVSTDAGVSLSASPKRGNSGATQAQALRKAFGDLRRYLEDLVQKKIDGDDSARREALFQGRDLKGEAAKGRAMVGAAWKVEGLERVPRGEVDEKQAPLLALVEGQMAAWFYCGRAQDVPRALEIARDNGFLARTTLVLGGDSWKAAERIAEAGVPVVWDDELEHSERDVITGELVQTFVLAPLEAAGVRYALSTDGPQWYQAAIAVGRGIAREKALAAVTSVPAEILGLGKRVGSLEVGKDGNVLLLSGDPLSIHTFVERVVVEGVPVYDRATDIRIQHLVEGLTPPGTQPMGQGAEPNPHEHNDPEEPESKQGKGYKEGKGKDGAEKKKTDDDHSAGGGDGR
ncbi:MAG TPA: amidohydrolase family protein [Planctomycetota bacterium]|nr:amidohydrolase family protein [Planctomycetota bacterium]